MKARLGISGLVMIYVGNLEPYQGIDLLLRSFGLALKKTNGVDLVIVGGHDREVEKYRKTAKRLAIDQKVHFTGAMPLEALPEILSEADILVSPRKSGTNTPMKIYPYLQSGKPILATNLLTHTQVLNCEVAVLADPYPEAFSEAMVRLIQDGEARKTLGMAGKRFVEEEFSYDAFRTKVNDFMDWLESEIVGERKPAAANRASTVE